MLFIHAHKTARTACACQRLGRAPPLQAQSSAMQTCQALSGSCLAAAAAVHSSETGTPGHSLHTHLGLSYRLTCLCVYPDVPVYTLVHPSCLFSTVCSISKFLNILSYITCICASQNLINTTANSGVQASLVRAAIPLSHNWTLPEAGMHQQDRYMICHTVPIEHGQKNFQAMPNQATLNLHASIATLKPHSCQCLF